MLSLPLFGWFLRVLSEMTIFLDFSVVFWRFLRFLADFWLLSDRFCQKCRKVRRVAAFGLRMCEEWLFLGSWEGLGGRFWASEGVREAGFGCQRGCWTGQIGFQGGCWTGVGGVLYPGRWYLAGVHPPARYCLVQYSGLTMLLPCSSGSASPSRQENNSEKWSPVSDFLGI